MRMIPWMITEAGRLEGRDLVGLLEAGPGSAVTISPKTATTLWWQQQEEEEEQGEGKEGRGSSALPLTVAVGAAAWRGCRLVGHTAVLPTTPINTSSSSSSRLLLQLPDWLPLLLLHPFSSRQSNRPPCPPHPPP